MDEILYNFIIKIESIALDTQGILWGSYVTLKCLHSYYSDIYYNEDLPIEKYWDITFHPETKDRILQCNKISIAFPKLQNYAKFWKKCENNNITIIYNNDYKMIIKEYPELQIYIIIMSEGGLLPPFKELLFLCDGFIMLKENNKIKINYSRYTGTPYDYLSDKKFKIVEENIFKDLYRKQTLICNVNECNIDTIYKIINNGWKISNLPYSVISERYDISECEELLKFTNNHCFICLDKLFSNNITTGELAIIYKNIHRPETVFYPIHHKCLIQYIKHKNTKKLRCPYRYIINFDDCNILLNYDYYTIKSNKQMRII